MRSSKGSWLILSLAVLGLLVAGCAPAIAPTPAPKSGTSPEAKPTTPAPTPKGAGETPKYGGVFTSYITGNPPSLDAQQEPSLNIWMTVAPFYTNLIQIDPFEGQKWVPGLAERWGMSADGLNWTFDIRQDVKFHDGTPFAVDDAVAHLKRLTDPPKGIISNTSFLLKPVVKSIERAGNTVKVNLNYPFAVMLATLGTNFSPVYSEKYVERNGDMKRTAMGTGPFKFKSYTPGVGIEGVKNPDFWVKGRPYLDGFRYLILSDAATRLSAFRTGRVSMTGKQFAALTATEMETAKKEDPQSAFYPSPSLLSPWFFMNMKKPPFQDQRVRKAVNLVVDRQAALKVLAEGHGVIANAFPLEPWGIPREELVKTPGYRQPKDADIAEAKRLMAEAGYPNGFDLTVLARSMLQSKDAAVFMTSQLAKIGIRAKVQVLEDAIFWETGRKAAHEAMVYTPAWYIPDPHWQGRFWAPGNPLNFAGNDDDQDLAKMWDDQIKVVGLEKRKALLQKVEERLLETLPGISIIWLQSFIGVRAGVRNFAPGMSDAVGNTLEEIWLTK